MNNYCMIQNSKTFAFSAENPTGVRAGGSQGGDCTKLRPTVTIPAGETVTLVDAAGPGVIQHMWFTGYVGHHFIIRMYWDDQEYPSVEAPLSAFFGCAYDENFVDRDGKYPVLNSAMMLVAPGRGYNSYFEMPFHKRARITMENRGDKDENLYYIITGAYQEIPAEAGYFHATYRQEHPVQKGRTYTIVDGIEGRGQFVGVTLATGMNGNNTCWVEGEAACIWTMIRIRLSTIPELKTTSAVPMDLEMTSSSRAIRPSAAYIPACMQSMETTGNSITDSRDSCCIISILQTRSVLRISFV